MKTQLDRIEATLKRLADESSETLIRSRTVEADLASIRQSLYVSSERQSAMEHRIAQIEARLNRLRCETCETGDHPQVTQ